MAVEQRYCSKCGKTLAETNFYTYKNGEKCELCKPCLTLHINNWEPDTFTWLLEKFDVPWLPWEWNVLRDRAYAKNPYKMTGMSVFGKYLSKMKLKQWNQYGWADTERLQKEHDEEVNSLGGNQDQAQLDAIKEAFENGEITEAQYKTYAETHAPDPGMIPPEANAPGGPPHAGGFEYPVNSPYEEVELVDVGADLTNDDKVYLAMKWGRLYRADEWVSLEKLYNEFKESFDIQGAAREDTLKMICKTSLKMNQAIDCGDVDAYQKLSRVYDAMMKSAKFTEAQNKDGKGDFVDSVGEMVAYCEKEGGQIPPHKIDVPYDVVDKIINDLKLYNKTLVYEDKALAEEVENYIKAKRAADEMRKDREEARAKGLDEIELTDDDYAEFSEEIANQKAEDEYLITEESDEE